MSGKPPISLLSFASDPRHYTRYHPEMVRPEGLVRLFPESVDVVVNNLSGCVTLVNWRAKTFIAQQTFTDEELPLVRVLLEAWPSAVMYEELLSVFDGVELSKEHEIMQLAREKGTVDLLFEPLLDVLDTAAAKLAVFKLRVEQEREFGWKLREVL